jgi:hypothetical protein
MARLASRPDSGLQRSGLGRVVDIRMLAHHATVTVRASVVGLERAAGERAVTIGVIDGVP